MRPTSQTELPPDSGARSRGKMLTDRRSLDESGSELWRYVAVLWERRWAVLLMLVLWPTAAWLWTKSQPRVYETKSSVLVEANVPQVLGSAVQDVVDPTPANYYLMQDFLQTSRKVLTSDSLSRRVALRLRLLSEPGFFAGGTPPQTIEEAGEALLSYYSADVVAETRVLLMTARHTSPDWAKKIADAVADEFVADAAQSREVVNQRTSEQLADELDRLRKSLHGAELALYEFKSKHDLLTVSMEDRTNQVARQIDKFSDALTEVKLRKLQRQSQLTELRKLKELDALHVPVLGGDMPQILGDLRRAYTEEQRRLAELKTRYQDTHPQVQQQTSKVDQILRELAREVDVALSASQIRYSEALSDEQKVQNELQIVKQEGMRLSRLEIEYNKLKRDADSFQKQYNLILNREKESGMVGRLRLSNIKVLDYARRPKIPVSPRVRVVLALSLVLAGLFGVLLALGLDALDRTVKAPQDIESSLGLPLLGMLPSFAVDGNAKGRYPPDLYVAYHPRSTVAEACRAIRTNLTFAGADQQLRTLLLTSSLPREGKTLCCVSLGTVLAKSGQKTLIIDCDLRRPRIARAFGLSGTSGLTNVLVGELSLDEAIRSSEVENLSVLPAGPTPPNPAELLSGQHFRQLLADAAGRFDRVLIDSPPAVPVTDPAILATLVDGVVLIVRHAQTPKEAATRAAQHVLDVGGRIVGVVLNAIDVSGKGYRSYYGHYSEYKSDESPSERSAAKPATE
ncbi:MAG TPA: polysaccharide biosynthesis tyrosine autokinase [Pseudomonadota bacterium]|nr:polysaccharide biosynthesis tyrosine autokinase [Pseudomonadota bacterium]HNN52575.1 polysaccharide biosynthesis tyrosine autokinase [Pseudomonadota bacterium]